MKNIYKAALVSFAVLLGVSQCEAAGKISLDKIFKKLDKIDETIAKDKKDRKETCFRNTLSIGPNLGYSFTEAYTADKNIDDVVKNMGLKRYKANGHSIGLHIDYNHFVTESVFVGIGYSVSYFPPSKEYPLFSVSTALNENNGDINYKNKSIVLINKKNSQYLTLRAGTLISEYITLDASVSMAVSEFNVKGAIFTHELIRGFGDVYNFNRLKNDIEKPRSYGRVGVAPGLGVNISLNRNFSLGLNYMCEIYPKNKDGLKPKMISHNYFTKLSYHI